MVLLSIAGPQLLGLRPAQRAGGASSVAFGDLRCTRRLGGAGPLAALALRGGPYTTLRGDVGFAVSLALRGGAYTILRGTWGRGVVSLASLALRGERVVGAGAGVATWGGRGFGGRLGCS